MHPNHTTHKHKSDNLFMLSDLLNTLFNITFWRGTYFSYASFVYFSGFLLIGHKVTFVVDVPSRPYKQTDRILFVLIQQIIRYLAMEHDCLRVFDCLPNIARHGTVCTLRDCYQTRQCLAVAFWAFGARFPDSAQCLLLAIESVFTLFFGLRFTILFCSVSSGWMLAQFFCIVFVVCWHFAYPFCALYGDLLLFIPRGIKRFLHPTKQTTWFLFLLFQQTIWFLVLRLDCLRVLARLPRIAQHGLKHTQRICYMIKQCLEAAFLVFGERFSDHPRCLRLAITSVFTVFSGSCFAICFCNVFTGQCFTFFYCTMFSRRHFATSFCTPNGKQIPLIIRILIACGMKALTLALSDLSSQSVIQSQLAVDHSLHSLQVLMQIYFFNFSHFAK